MKITRVKGLYVSAAAGLLGALVACSATSVDGAAATDNAFSEDQLKGVLDVNDVSILFPLSEAMPIADGSAGESARAVFTTNFDAIEAHATKQGIQVHQGGADDIKNWKVVAVRFDPCAPGFSQSAMTAAGAVLTRLGTPAAAACIPQIRFIAQPVSGPSTTDFAAHLVFDLPAITSPSVDVDAIKEGVAKSHDVQNAVRLLQAIKQASNGATAGQPLGVHPGFKASPAAVRPLIKQLMAISKRPNSVAFMGLRGQNLPWAFFAGRIVADGTWSPVPSPVIPAMKPEQNAIVFDGLSILPSFAGTVRAENAFDVENAAKAHFFSMDCGSCHVSSGSFVFGRPLEQGFPAGRLPRHITGYIARESAQNLSWNVRNFGYFFGNPSVSGRALSETIDVVKFINQHCWAEGCSGPQAPLSETDPTPLLGPGPDCSDQDLAVWICLRDGQLLGGGGGNGEGGSSGTSGSSGSSTGGEGGVSSTSNATVAQCFSQCANGGKLPVPATTIVPPTRITALPNTAEGEPCTAAEAKPDETSVAVVGTKATLSGNDKLCLSRNLHGTFGTTGNEATITCASLGAECTVSLIAAKVTLTGNDAKFLATKVFVTAGKAFRSRGQGGAVLIDCAADGSTCTLAVSAQASSVPQPAQVIDPTN